MIRLVDEWHKCWRWASVQLAAVISTAGILYEQLPQFQQYIPPELFHKVMPYLVAVIIAGRLFKLKG